MPRVIIAGGREFVNYKFMYSKLDALLRTTLHRHNENVELLEIVEGGALGADRGSRLYAIQEGIPYKTFEADWSRYGKQAGYIRNKEMAEYASEIADAGALIAFWDGQSRGTSMMIDLAKDYGLEIKIVRY